MVKPFVSYETLDFGKSDDDGGIRYIGTVTVFMGLASKSGNMIF